MGINGRPVGARAAAAGILGHALTAAVPGQQRPADQYLVGWARDFITVLAPS